MLKLNDNLRGKLDERAEPGKDGQRGNKILLGYLFRPREMPKEEWSRGHEPIGLITGLSLTAAAAAGRFILAS
jgi:hypothetical protein